LALSPSVGPPGSRNGLDLMIDPRLQRTARVIFNFLEDARVARVATSDEPELAGASADHLNAAVDQIDQFSGTSGSGSAPTDQRNQLVFAVLAYIPASRPGPQTRAASGGRGRA